MFLSACALRTGFVRSVFWILICACLRLNLSHFISASLSLFDGYLFELSVRLITNIVLIPASSLYEGLALHLDDKFVGELMIEDKRKYSDS